VTGLKSGSGDDLWGDDDGDDGAADDSGAGGDGSSPDGGAEAGPAASDSDSAGADAPGTESNGPAEATADEPDADGSGAADRTNGPARVGPDPRTGDEDHSYIVRRAIRDKSVQFERDDRLTFFVHRDVVDGERRLVSELESAVGRDVPKFDVREAVYRAALRNPDDVLDELLAMGYSDGE
jgi:hypothetical protein